MQEVAATRAKDRQDVADMQPTRQELDWVAAFLRSIADREDVTKALAFVDSLAESV
jgi:hypothetical protein